MHPLHDINPGTENEINTIIEIAKYSKNKYEIDKETGLITLDRVMHTSQDFPFDYGFVPQTLSEDNDPLDVILLTTYPLLPGILVKVRPIAILKMVDSGDNDDKIIAVPISDPRMNALDNLNDINSHFLKEIEHFYTTYKQIQKKEVKIIGFFPKTEAILSFKSSIERYKNNLKKK